MPKLAVEEKTVIRNRKNLERPRELLGNTDKNHCPKGHDVEVRRESEELSSFLDPSKIPVDQENNDCQRDLKGVGTQRRNCRSERRSACRCLDSNGHRVVNQKRDCSNLSDLVTKIVSRNNVRTAELRISTDDIEIRHRHEEQDPENGERDRNNQGEGSKTNKRGQLGKHLLGAVGRR